MIVQSLVEDVENSKPYKEWKSGIEQHVFLVSIFAQIEDEKPIVWHVNYYCPGTDKSMTFTTYPSIEAQSESTLASDNPKPLNPDEAKVSFPEIMERASEAMSSNYPNHTFSKMLATLHQEEHPIWTVNFLTHQSQTINIKLSADSGEIISHKAFSLKDLT
ncbi:MAG TPA: hypothetical protein VJB90_02560 [Candidatus Nanoarchaeia archaeon]|nr:hypothetical protein [Candidatus Nanoarchaeia archaeon]